MSLFNTGPSIKLPSFKGLVKFLFFTHNTMLSVLYTIMTNPDVRYIRSVDHLGNPINKGGQFRNGLDSQYGDVIFVMKQDFWKDMNGTDYRNGKVVPNMYVGHVFKRDFVEYSGEGNVNIVHRWLEKDARLYDFRRPIEPGTIFGMGRECRHHEWNISWCNLQIHAGQNVGLEHVWKVYVPAWFLHDTEAVQKIEQKKTPLNATFLRLILSNKLPHFPEDGSVNPLNGRFHLYGPKKADEHYYHIKRDNDKFDSSTLATALYHDIHPRPAVDDLRALLGGVATYRISSHSSSTIFLHENAFTDVEVKYMTDLVRNNMTTLPPEEADKIKALELFPYDDPPPLPPSIN